MIDIEKLENILSEIENLQDELVAIANSVATAKELNDSIMVAVDEYISVVYDEDEEEG